MITVPDLCRVHLKHGGQWVRMALSLEETDLLVDPVEQKLRPHPESPYLPTLRLK